MRECLLFFILITTVAFGQDSTNCTFLFPTEGKYEIRIDSTDIYTKNTFKVKSGIHLVEIWNAGTEMITDTIHAKAYSTLVFNYPIKVDENYQAYRKELNTYRVNMFTYCFLPIPLCIGLGTGTYLLKNRTEASLKEIEDFKPLYALSSDPVFLDSYPEKYNKKVKTYNSNRAFFYTTLSLAIVSVGFSAFTIWRFVKKFNKPKNTFFKSPFSEIDYSLNFNGNATTFHMSLTI